MKWWQNLSPAQKKAILIGGAVVAVVAVIVIVGRHKSSSQTTTTTSTTTGSSTGAPAGVIPGTTGGGGSRTNTPIDVTVTVTPGSTPGGGGQPRARGPNTPGWLPPLTPGFMAYEQSAPAGVQQFLGGVAGAVSSGQHTFAQLSTFFDENMAAKQSGSPYFGPTGVVAGGGAAQSRADALVHPALRTKRGAA